MFSSKKHKYYTIKINVILINLGMNAENTQELLNKYISRWYKWLESSWTKCVHTYLIYGALGHKSNK